jgi:hypothetical protein
MHPAYFETHFLVHEAVSDWPPEFAIITAHATTGEVWTPEQNKAADRELEAELRRSTVWLKRLTGYSPTSGHEEAGWAVELSLAESSALGRRYRQDAIYWVSGDSLRVTYCEPAKRALVLVGSFRSRLKEGKSVAGL